MVFTLVRALAGLALAGAALCFGSLPLIVYGAVPGVITCLAYD